MTENQLEQDVLASLKEVGYLHRHGPAIAPDSSAPGRANERQALLTFRLREAIHRLNPGMPTAAREEALRQVQDPALPDLLAANQHLHRLLLDGVPVRPSQDDGAHSDRVRLIDWARPERNEWLVVTRFSIQGPQHTHRPDLVLFVNGLPLVLIALEPPATSAAKANSGPLARQAPVQIQTCKAQIPALFQSNALLVITDGTQARLGSVSSEDWQFRAWQPGATPAQAQAGGCSGLQALVRDVLAPKSLLAYVRNFVLFGDTGTPGKTLAASHQFQAVHAALAQIVKASRAEACAAHKGQGGVLWHTQGSGKHTTLLCLAARVAQESALQHPTVLVMTDPDDLDGHLRHLFSQNTRLSGETPVPVHTRQDLRAQLALQAHGGLVLAARELLRPQAGGSDDAMLLSARHNIVVIVDELHTTPPQAPLPTPRPPPTLFDIARAAIQAITLKQGDGPPTSGGSGPATGGAAASEQAHDPAAISLREALPHATFVAFTSTPIAQDDHDIRRVFGDMIHVHDLQQAREDGATVPLYSELRQARLRLNLADMPLFDTVPHALAEADEEHPITPLHSGWMTLEKAVGSRARLARVAADLVAHFETRQAAWPGKALAVVMSRDAGVHLYNAIVALRPGWHDSDPEKGAVKLVLSGAASDKPGLQPHLHSAPVRQRLAARLQQADDPLHLVIVRDLWLAGLDVPCLHTVYIDKPLQGHALMQTLTSVNRAFRDKPGGLVVDYLGLGDALKAAQTDYAQAQGQGRLLVNVNEAYGMLLEQLGVLRPLLHGLDERGLQASPRRKLARAANHVLGRPALPPGTGLRDDTRQHFVQATRALNQAFILCCTLDDVHALREEVDFLRSVQHLLEPAAHSTPATGLAILEALGLELPPPGLPGEALLSQLQRLPERHLAVELLERLLESGLQSRLVHNVEQNRLFAALRTDVLGRYQRRMIGSVQALEALLDLARRLGQAAARTQALGLNEEEACFFDALHRQPAAKDQPGDELLGKIARELIGPLRESLRQDSAERESTRTRLRQTIRRILRKYPYPPDPQDAATERVLEQALALQEHWRKP